jgi:acyl carrier protein
MNNQHNRSDINRSQIAQLVISSLQEVLDMGNGTSPAVEDIGTGTSLIGREAVLDSMGLVNLIVEIEQRLEEDYGVVVILADERAMSQKKSPFHSVGSLTDYICQLIQEQG